MLLVSLSETGTGESIIKRISQILKYDHQIDNLVTISSAQYASVDWSTLSHLIVVCSSTGDGDFPESALSMVTFLRSKCCRLDGVKLCQLSLGSSDYSTFMGAPRALHEILLRLGCQDLIPVVEADDATPSGLEESVEPWIHNVIGALSRLKIGKVSRSKADSAAAPKKKKEARIPKLPRCPIKVVLLEEHSSSVASSDDAQDTLHCVVTSNQRLTNRANLLQLTLPDGCEYMPGDVFSFIPPMPSAMVDSLLQRLSLDPLQLFTVEPIIRAPAHLTDLPRTFKSAFTHCFDISEIPSKRTLRVLAEYCGLESEKQTLLDYVRINAQGRANYEKLISGRPSLLQLLQRYPSCVPPIEALMNVLPATRPRHYSAASACNSTLDFVFTVVSSPRAGVATSHLAALPVGSTLGLTLRPPSKFRFPEDDLPLIMVGPGTGVAPFRGFCQHMASGQRSSESHLFFGCRTKEEQLFKEEMEKWVEDGVLTSYNIAYSREKDMPKQYVQHLLVEQQEMLNRCIVDGNGRVYVCGDISKMGADVEASLATALGSPAYVAQMKKDHRLVFDIWS